MQTPDGRRTNKFDTVVPSAYLDELDGVQNKLLDFESSIRSDISDLKTQISKVDRSHEDTEKELEHRCDVMEAHVEKLERLTLAFLCSPIMRFFNFFGCWYIYADGYPLLNRPENEKYGKAPLLTRISRWFRKHFLKQSTVTDTYYKSEDTKESNTEVCTNENRDVAERVEAPESEGPEGSVLERDPDGNP